MISCDAIHRWQPADYADFRVNYATHMHNPAIELEEEGAAAAGDPAPAVPDAANADAPAATTATVEGVLVVAASPAPAPLTSRSASPDAAGTGGRRHGGGGGGGSHKADGSGGGGAAAPSQDRLSSKPSKLTRYEKVRGTRQKGDVVAGKACWLARSLPDEALFIISRCMHSLARGRGDPNKNDLSCLAFSCVVYFCCCVSPHRLSRPDVHVPVMTLPSRRARGR